MNAHAQKSQPRPARKFRRVRSTYIEGLHMDGENLHVLFKNGKHYRYRVGRDNLLAMLQAPSWPSYFAKHIRPHFPGDLIEGENVEVFGQILKRGQRR